MGSVLRVVLWNIEWRTSRSRAEAVIRGIIDQLQPDIVCLTEAHDDFFAGRGHTICSEPDYGYRLQPGRRKVLLWSAEPWVGVDQVGSAELPSGRFVVGRTATALGELDVVGICIPFADAHVSTGRKDRAKWQDHVTYLDALASVLAPRQHSTVVLGDFNQRVPRKTAPRAVFEALDRTVLSRFTVPTQGVASPAEEQLVDHLAHTPELVASEVRTLSRRGPKGENLSDHLGVYLELRRA